MGGGARVGCWWGGVSIEGGHYQSRGHGKEGHLASLFTPHLTLPNTHLLSFQRGVRDTQDLWHFSQRKSLPESAGHHPTPGLYLKDHTFH